MGKRTDGVRTVEDLLARCRLETGAPAKQQCWHWAGGKSAGRPSLWLPALQRRVPLGVAICVLATGKVPDVGVVWHCTCRTPNCANPEHRTSGTRSSQMLSAQLKRDAATRVRIAAGKRANSKLTDAAVDEIRLGSEPLRVVAARHGISIEHSSNIRRGEARRPLGGASVFNLGS